MVTLASTTTQLRARIVPGPDALLNLIAEVPDKLKLNAGKNPEPPKFIDGLKLLAGHDCEVLIPEAVSLKIAGIDAKGRNCRKPLNRLDSFRASDSLSDFLVRAAKGEWGPRIRIVPPAAADTSPAAQFVREIHRGMELVDVGATKMGSYTIKEALNTRNNICTDATATLIHELPVQDAPIILLTGNHHAPELAIHGTNPLQRVILLNTQGFLAGMKDNGLLKPMHVRGDATVAEMVGAINQHNASNQKKLGHGAEHALHENCVLDQCHGLARKTFTQLLEGTAAEIRSTRRAEARGKKEEDLPDAGSDNQRRLLETAEKARRQALLEKFSRRNGSNGHHVNGNGRE